MNNIYEKYLDNIEVLIKHTNEGKIGWRKTNPTTYIWSSINKTNTKFTTIIQAVTDGPWEEETYYFKILKHDNEVVIDIDTESNESFFSLLQTLYNSIFNNIEKKNLDFFNEILDLE
ncbi:hypothetical protein [Carboxylicivirga sp. M1479]|uniref:hypothetical protein n=1 Tax=Carboxylicivirga sp. M1479 TaxID=2594476 RepID=UPI0011789259|nr:hypothetical protein [Carboxylicivirga sp. M1479]TRX70521.1 hypothetical protein FNN09_11120 [Carboxylicivirga sp. M1479]